MPDSDVNGKSVPCGASVTRMIGWVQRSVTLTSCGADYELRLRGTIESMEHTRHTLLKSRLALVRRDLDEIVQRLTSEILSWAPAEGMRTVSGQLVEIIGTEIQLISQLKDNLAVSDQEVKEILGDCESLANLRSKLIDVRDQSIKYLDALSEEELVQEVHFDQGWFASLTLSTVPRAEVFLNKADHEWYHVGQLTSYLWTRGDDPYEW